MGTTPRELMAQLLIVAEDAPNDHSLDWLERNGFIHRRNTAGIPRITDDGERVVKELEATWEEQT